MSQMSAKDPAPVDAQGLPSDEAGVVGGEEGDGCGDVVRAAPALDALAAELPGGHGLRVVDDRVLGGDADGTSRDAVGGDAGGAEFAGEGAGESFEAGFRADVANEVVAARRGEDGADRDDPAPTGSRHSRGELVREEVVARQVGGQGVFPMGGRCFRPRSARVGAGVADQDVEWAESVVGLVAEGAHGVGFAEVGRQRDGGAVAAGDLGGEFRCGMVVVEVSEGDGGAVGGEAASDGRTDAAGGSGDQGGAAVQGAGHGDSTGKK